MNKNHKKTSGQSEIYDQAATNFSFISSYKDFESIISFLVSQSNNVTFSQKLSIIQQLYKITSGVECPHAQHEIIKFIEEILSIPDGEKGVIVEAGCFKGGSAAKFSVAAKLTGRNLIIFDSFQGLPKNKEYFHDVILYFPEESFRASLREVKKNISNFGDIEVCSFVKGWFNDTMPKFNEPIAALYLDVDLASSTKTCLKYLYPLLVPGGVLISQDGHLPLVAEVFNDSNFWEKEVGCHKPKIEGLWQKKLIKIVRPL